jgi:hypothetical protein
MVIALAGRRIDSSKAKRARFPLKNVSLVEKRISFLLDEKKPHALVCSAANGVDLLALQSAEERKIESYVILPFPLKLFRSTSVTDRPGKWGKRFDHLVEELPQENIISLGLLDPGAEAYWAANRAIFEHALRIAHKRQVNLTAVIVWDGSSRGPHDMTLDFKRTAIEQNLPVLEISTL